MEINTTLMTLMFPGYCFVDGVFSSENLEYFLPKLHAEPYKMSVISREENIVLYHIWKYDGVHDRLAHLGHGFFFEEFNLFMYIISYKSIVDHWPGIPGISVPEFLKRVRLKVYEKLK